MLATVGFILVIAMVALIIWGKVALPPILILLSTAAVIVLSLVGALPDVVGPLAILDALKGYITTGANSVLNTVVLFTFAIVYFNVLSDAGMFDMIVGAVTGEEPALYFWDCRKQEHPMADHIKICFRIKTESKP